MWIEQPAEVRSAVDLEQLAREARRVNIEIQDGERLVETTEENLKDRRLRLGKLLIEARKGFGKRGDGFQKWISNEIGISQDTATRYMKAAGYEPDRGNHPQSAGDSTQRAKTKPSLPASVEIEDSDENEVESPQTEPDYERHAPESYLAAYLIRADQAVRFAVYKGPVTPDAIAMARRVADAWARLAETLEAHRE